MSGPKKGAGGHRTGPMAHRRPLPLERKLDGNDQEADLDMDLPQRRYVQNIASCGGGPVLPHYFYK